MKPLLSFVIPCYHSEKTIGKVVAEIDAVVEADGRYEYEVVLVNDNPPDATWNAIQELCAANPRVRGLCMIHNFGQHAALMAGYNEVKGDIVVSLDDDGQTPPDEVFKLVDALQGNVDLVYASYPENAYSNTFRKLGSKMNDKMAQSLIGKPRDVYLSSYLAAKRRVIDSVAQYKGPYPYIDGLLLQCCTEVASVPLRHDDRMSGQSGYSLRKLISLWLNGFTSFSIKPLRVSTFAGFIFAFLGFIFAIVIIVRKLILGDEIDAGWSSIMSMIMIIGGIIMMMIGMAGEYIGRIFISMNGAPQYIVGNRTGADSPTDQEPGESPFEVDHRG